MINKPKFKWVVCGHEWNPRINNPSRCPNQECHSVLWKIGYNKRCDVCNRLVLVPEIHHIDGNHNHDWDLNRLIVCKDCHTAIHFGIGNEKYKGRKRKRRHYILEPEIRLKLKELKLNLRKNGGLD